MNFELIVALRYLREGRGQTALILTGIAVGVGVIVFLSALINGLQTSLIDRTLGSQAHVVVRPPEELPRVLTAEPGTLHGVIVQRPPQRVRSIKQWQQAREDIARFPGVVAVAPTVIGPAMASRGPGSSAVAVRGIDPEQYQRIVALREKLVAGSLDLTGFRALIGIDLADDLGVRVGDRVRLQAGLERTAVYTVAGIFDFGNRDLNQRWVFVSLRAAQALFALDGGVSTLEVRGTRIFDAEALAQRITERTGLVADSWMAVNAQLLVGLRSQSSSSYMIQTFVILAVALGIASVLAVSVVQKSREIGILRATGAPRGRVMRIFLIQGGLLGLAGSALGILLGIVLALLFASLAKNPDGSATFPVELTAALFLRAAATAVGVGILAGLFPARRAARMDPAAVIRGG
ncbi:MAG: ABC transporter permease [Gemmatimonadetes bacterium]|nr:ABC transporter permease [Gemmatimonadota bacterium]